MKVKGVDQSVRPIQRWPWDRTQTTGSWKQDERAACPTSCYYTRRHFVLEGQQSVKADKRSCTQRQYRGPTTATLAARMIDDPPRFDATTTDAWPTSMSEATTDNDATTASSTQHHMGVITPATSYIYSKFHGHQFRSFRDRGGSKNGHSHYLGYWLLRQPVLPYKPWSLTARIRKDGITSKTLLKVITLDDVECMQNSYGGPVLI